MYHSKSIVHAYNYSFTSFTHVMKLCIHPWLFNSSNYSFSQTIDFGMLQGCIHVHTYIALSFNVMYN